MFRLFVLGRWAWKTTAVALSADGRGLGKRRAWACAATGNGSRADGQRDLGRCPSVFCGAVRPRRGSGRPGRCWADRPQGRSRGCRRRRRRARAWRAISRRLHCRAISSPAVLGGASACRPRAARSRPWRARGAGGRRGRL